MSSAVFWAVFPVGLALAGLIVFWFVYWRKRVVWFNPEERAKLKAYECPGCAGYGEQILLPHPERPHRPNGRPNLVWQAIPMEMRVIQKGINPATTSSPHGNRRACHMCHGIGHYWDTLL